MSRVPKPLTNDERQLAHAAARVIETAEEVGLPDAPEKLVTSPNAFRALARSYLELRRQVQALRDLADPADPNDPIGTALTAVGLTLIESTKLHEKLWQTLDDFASNVNLTVRSHNVLVNAGISYVGELVQADRRTLLKFKNFGKISLHEIEKALAQLGLFLGRALEDWPGPRWECRAEYPYLRKIEPQLVEVKTDIPQGYVSYPKDPAVLTELRIVQGPITGDPLVALYCRVMGDIEATFLKYKTFIVRQWDGMDGCWTDCTGQVDREHALHYWSDRTDGGTRRVSYTEIDYYRIFPGGTRMNWDGSEGREMHR